MPRSLRLRASGLRVVRSLAPRILAFVLLIAGPATASWALDASKQMTQYMLSTWEIPQGLPQNTVEEIAQTPDGYLWLATQEGLGRFDGIRFTVFDRGNTPELESNLINALLADSKGRLWIGTGKGVAMLERGSFHSYLKSDGLAGNYVRELHEDRDGSIWVATEGGLTRIGDGKLTSFGTEDGLADRSIRALYQDRRGTLWVGTARGGLHRLESGRFEAVQLDPAPAANAVRAFVEDQDGTLWLATFQGDLYRGRDGAFTKVRSPENLGSAVHELLRDRDGNLWVATLNGLGRLTPGGEYSLLTAAQGLPSTEIRSLLEDSEGNLWVGTNGGGVVRLRDGKIASYGEREGLRGHLAWTVAQEPTGDLLIGTEAGLSRYSNGAFTDVTAAVGLTNRSIKAVLVDDEGAIWMGTDGEGLHRLHRGRVTTLTTHSGLAGDTVNGLLEDRAGRLWIGSNGGLARLIDGRPSAVRAVKQLGVVAVNLLHEDRRGGLWLGTEAHGLLLLEGETLRRFGDADGLPNSRVLAIHEDEGGALWFGTLNGLARLKDGRFFAFNVAGPLRETILQVLEDTQGTLWLTTNKGLVSVSRAALDDFADGDARAPQVQVYGIADGMRAAECNGGHTAAGIVTAQGELWVPTIRGVVRLNPARLPTNAVAPPVLIERVLADARQLELAGDMQVEPGPQHWEFQFTAPSLRIPERVQFRYRLDGFDPHWIDAGTRRAAYYTRLPPGQYTFRVIAANDDGVWNEQGAVLTFELLPYFYQTTWFKVLCALAAAALLWSGHRLHVHRQIGRAHV